MRVLIIFLMFFCGVAFGQDYKELDREVYVYKTFEDAQNDKGEFIGEYESHKWTNDLVSNKNILFVKKDGAEIKYPLKHDELWGFRVGNVVFRMAKRLPVTIVKISDLIFYNDGYMFLNYLDGEGMKTTRSTDVIYYSDNLESDIHVINRVLTYKKDIPEMEGFLKCIDESLHLRGYQNRVDGCTVCIEEYYGDDRD